MAGRLIGYVRRNAIGLLALFVALGGTSYAVTAKKFVGGDGQVRSCATTKTGAVRLVAKGKHCRRSEQAVTWSQRGPVGARGLQGAHGAEGAQGAAGPAGSIQGATAGGDLAGSYPDPTIAAAPAPVDVADNPNTAADPCLATTPQTLVLCGTNVNRWSNGGFGIPGIQVWRDRIGQVHIRGSATVGTMSNAQPALFVLPESQRPKRALAFPIATGNSAGAQTEKGALLIITEDGFVGVATNATDKVAHIGDIAFRTDA